MTTTPTAPKKSKKPETRPSAGFVVANQVPIIFAPATVTTHCGRTVQAGFSAYDPNGDSLTYAKVSGPGFVEPATGLATFTATGPGFVTITAKANDGQADSAPATWVINVMNAPPMFTTGPTHPAHPGKTYKAYYNATDMDGDALTYSIVSGPGSINTATGLFTWDVPPLQSQGMVQLRLRVTDSCGASTEQTFYINVMNPPGLALVRPKPSPSQSKKSGGNSRKPVKKAK